MAELSPQEAKVLLALQEKTGGAAQETLVGKHGLAGPDVAMGASWLRAKGLLEWRSERRERFRLTRQGEKYAASGLPERQIVNRLHGLPGHLAPVDEFGWLTPVGLSDDEIKRAIGWLRRKGLAVVEPTGAAGRSNLRLTAMGESGRRTADEHVLQDLYPQKTLFRHELDAEGLRLLLQRQDLLECTEESTRILFLTPEGEAIAASGRVVVEESIAQLTPQDIQSGRWQTLRIRPYDVQAFAPAVAGGKKHPMRQIIERIREIFLEMGFTEIAGDYVRSAFWNMDALFVPQDHSAREMQDTFYLDNPASADLTADAGFVEKVRAVHENGGDTGSRGWGGSWSRKEAERMLLRTHTTVDTITHLARDPRSPQRVFMVGRVFRKEAIDATHLPEFHQVEGIVVEEGASLRMLFGLLKEFYAKMGFPDVRVRPAFFPYTEPSAEVEVKWGDRWLELGGCGIFRPEVTLPVGVKDPVLAWGLGLERLAMLSLGLKDIRELYLSDLEWLRKQPMMKL